MWDVDADVGLARRPRVDLLVAQAELKRGGARARREGATTAAAQGEEARMGEGASPPPPAKSAPREDTVALLLRA